MINESICKYLDNENYYLTASHVAELMNQEEIYVRLKCKQNLIPYSVVDGSLRFNPRELAAWFRNHPLKFSISTAEAIESWVFEFVLVDDILHLPIPELLLRVFQSLGEHWIEECWEIAASEYPSVLIQYQVALYDALMNHLTEEERVELLAELIWTASNRA